jgi:hypothetical protein
VVHFHIGKFHTADDKFSSCSTVYFIHSPVTETYTCHYHTNSNCRKRYHIYWLLSNTGQVSHCHQRLSESRQNSSQYDRLLSACDPVSTLTTAHSASYLVPLYLPAGHQNHLHVAVSGCNLSSTPSPYIITSPHIHTTSLTRHFLSPCAGTHQGGGARCHVATWQSAAPVLASLTREEPLNLKSSAPQTLSTRRAGKLARTITYTALTSES